MLAEHNPIAELIHKIQTKWVKEASPFPHLKLVRWLIKPEEARLYEGFLKLESTEHGALPEMLVTMLTPFEREDTYAADLYADWMKALQADQKANQVLTAEQIKAVESAGASGPGSGQPDPDARLLKMLALFQQQLPGDTPFVLALLPRSIHDMEAYRLWLIRLLKKGIPAMISLMVFDHIGAYHLDGVVKKYPEITKSLSVILDMDGAVSKIVKSGNPNAPEVKLNECILEMGKGVQQNNPAKVDEWGEKALHITQRSGQKSLFATAHIVYAGMLFNFRQFEKIDALLAKGARLANQGLIKEAAACKPLVIQFHGYMAASSQLQKKNAAAVTGFEKQGDAAMEYGLPGMAINAYRQAYTLSKKNVPERYGELLEKALGAGRAMQHEEQLQSQLGVVAWDNLQWHEGKQRFEEVRSLDQEFTALLGTHWKEQARTSYETATLKTREPVT
jgi:hypothetical protein